MPEVEAHDTQPDGRHMADGCRRVKMRRREGEKRVWYVLVPAGQIKNGEGREADRSKLWKLPRGTGIDMDMTGSSTTAGGSGVKHNRAQDG